MPPTRVLRRQRQRLQRRVGAAHISSEPRVVTVRGGEGVGGARHHQVLRLPAARHHDDGRATELYLGRYWVVVVPELYLWGNWFMVLYRNFTWGHCSMEVAFLCGGLLDEEVRNFTWGDYC